MNPLQIASWNLEAAQNNYAQINKQLNDLTQSIRAFSNASPEQQANVDKAVLQQALDRYNQLKAQQAQASTAMAKYQTEYNTLMQQQQAQASAQRSWGRRVSNPTPEVSTTPEINYTPMPNYTPFPEWFFDQTPANAWVNEQYPAYNPRYDYTNENWDKYNPYTPWSSSGFEYAQKYYNNDWTLKYTTPQERVAYDNWFNEHYNKTNGVYSATPSELAEATVMSLPYVSAPASNTRTTTNSTPRWLMDTRWTAENPFVWQPPRTTAPTTQTSMQALPYKGSNNLTYQGSNNLTYQGPNNLPLQSIPANTPVSSVANVSWNGNYMQTVASAIASQNRIKANQARNALNMLNTAWINKVTTPYTSTVARPSIGKSPFLPQSLNTIRFK